MVSALFSYYVGRTLLGFVVYLSDVFPYDSECEQLASSEKEDGADDGREALDRLSVDKRLGCDVEHIADCEQRDDEAEHGGYPQGSCSVACDSLEREVDEPSGRHMCLSGGSVGGLEVYTGLPESHPAVESFGVALRFAQRADRVDRFSVEQAEIPYVGEHVDSGAFVKEAVICFGEEFSENRFLSS